MLRKALFSSVGVAVLVALVAMAWHYGLLSWAYWQEGGSNTSRSEVLRNVGLLVAGLIGLGFGIWRAYTAYRQAQASTEQAAAANEQAKAANEQVMAANEQAKAANEQARIAVQGHFTDRFSTAVEQLGSAQLIGRSVVTPGGGRATSHRFPDVLCTAKIEPSLSSPELPADVIDRQSRSIDACTAVHQNWLGEGSVRAPNFFQVLLGQWWMLMILYRHVFHLEPRLAVTG